LIQFRFPSERPFCGYASVDYVDKSVYNPVFKTYACGLLIFYTQALTLCQLAIHVSNLRLTSEPQIVSMTLKGVY